MKKYSFILVNFFKVAFRRFGILDANPGLWSHSTLSHHLSVTLLLYKYYNGSFIKKEKEKKTISLPLTSANYYILPPQCKWRFHLL